MNLLLMKRTSLALALLAAALSSCDHELIGTTGDCPPLEPDGSWPLCYPPGLDAGAEIDKTTCLCRLSDDAGR